MSNLKDWDTPFGPSSLFEKPKEMTRQEAIEIQKAQDDLEWESFRREAAKDILCAMLSTVHQAYKEDVTTAIRITDELIKQLREEK